MEITEVKVFPVHEEKLKAFVSIVIDDCFMVNDLKIIQGKDGLFLSMPSRRKKNGDYKDVAHPLNNETRRHLEERILGEYSRATAPDGTVPGGGSRDLGPRAAEPRPTADPGEQGARSLQEIEELHLRDSFWNVT